MQSAQPQCRYAQSMAGKRDIPTYSTAIRRPHHMVVLELEVLVEDGLVELDFSVEFVADLFPVGCWLGHVWSRTSGYHGAKWSEARCAPGWSLLGVAVIARSTRRGLSHHICTTYGGGIQRIIRSVFLHRNTNIFLIWSRVNICYIVVPTSNNSWLQTQISLLVLQLLR